MNCWKLLQKHRKKVLFSIEFIFFFYFFQISLSLRDNFRSESAKSFDSKAVNLALLQNLQNAYNSPQNRGIAQSFRYMRNKPTIIAFKTPSLESFETTRKEVEIGKIWWFILSFNDEQIFIDFSEKTDKKENPADESSTAEEGKVVKAVNFPVGKPLEVWKLFFNGDMEIIPYFSDFHRWTFRSPINAHLPSATRSFSWNWNRSDALRFHLAVHYEPLLQSSTFVSPLRILVGVWDPNDHHEPSKGWLFLDQPGSAIVRVVRQLAVTAGNRTGRARRCYGTIPWYGKLSFVHSYRS